MGRPRTAALRTFRMPTFPAFFCAIRAATLRTPPATLYVPASRKTGVHSSAAFPPLGNSDRGSVHAYLPRDCWSPMSRSRKGARILTPSDATPSIFALNRRWHLLACTIWFFVCSNAALPQQEVPQQAPANSSTSQSEVQQNPAELASHDEPTTFKVNVKLVLVRAVVRDSQGHAVGNLHQEDFQVFDKGKPQVISHFEVEQPGSLIAKARQKPKADSSDVAPDSTSSNNGPAPAVPERFVAYLFDDVHLEFGDLARVREAAERHFSNLRPTDRAAIFTTSGHIVLDYTDDRAQLHPPCCICSHSPSAAELAKTARISGITRRT
jgi:hypothetical protein